MGVTVDTKVYFARKPVTVICMEKIVPCLADTVWSRSHVITSMGHVKMGVTAATKDQSVWKNVKLIILDQTVKKCATLLAKAVTEQQGYVTLGVIRDGKDSFVKKLAIA